ncbi:diguanylate cyclase (GGDEF) domain-containing protein [Parafrankia irregularis]|uniref:Diguanylate cyclase (GGDEF) domain-containing protein n=1 Tax=Parafrankia irregularis TaxID=795642 RepID=A0A0S4QHZ3_9ACTN|nr:MULTISPECIES: sensor domain-containing diguanylate cyclase [Parafrankia]MBE3204006.1 diguanylate cyclase [Parafrankia sp. CH37]CUU55117.1 diguanylate cyclase (GGDEF) domain-containing protein [Parafrankia irregularis]
MRWRKLVDDLPVGVVVVTPPDERISYLNNRAVALFDRDRPELLGTPLMSQLSFDEWDELLPRDQHSSPDRHAMVIRRPGGSAMPVVMTRLASGPGRADCACFLQDRADGDLLREQVQTILAHSPVSFALLDASGRVLIGGGGIAPGAVAGLAQSTVSSVFEVFADEKELIELLRDAQSGHVVARTTAAAVGGQVDVSLTPLLDAHGKVTRMVGVGVDVTARERTRTRQAVVARFAHQALETADSAALWRLAVRTLAGSLNAHVSLWDVGCTAPMACTVPGAALGPPPGWASLVAAHLAGTSDTPAAGDIRYASVVPGWQTLVAGAGQGRRSARVVVVQRPSTGADTDTTTDTAGAPADVVDVADDEQHVRAIADVLVSATTRLAAERQLRYRSQHDDLTGLANRAALLDHLGQALDPSRGQGRSVAVIFLDLDGFKTINDNHGHTAGDAVLRAVANRLSGAVRPTDLVGRLGGDEFAIVCTEVRDRGQMERLARRVIARLGEAISVEGVLHTVTASAGVAISDAGRTSPDRLLNAADMSMYKAKQAGGGQSVTTHQV